MHHDSLHPSSGAARTPPHNGDADAIAHAIETGASPAHEPHGEHSHVPVHYSSKTRRNATIFALVVAITLSLIYYFGHRSRTNAELALAGQTVNEVNQPVPVDVVHVQRAPVMAVLSLPGRTCAWFEATLYGRVNGYVTEFKKDIGDHVKAGDVLAAIETPELDQQYIATKAKQQELEAERNVAQTAVEFAKITYQRWEQAAPDGVVAIQERDQKKSEWDVAVAKLKAAEAQIASGQAELNRLQTMLDFKQVRAPFDGVITAREVDKGSLVTAGSTTNTTPLFTIARYDTVRVFIDVPEGAVPSIANGMDVSVEAREYPGRSFTGKVARTAEAIDTVSKTLKVEVDVPNAKLKLLPGMYVLSSFQTNRGDPPLRVPAAALAFGPRGAEVVVVDADRRVKFQPITIGRDLGDAVEISSGLTGNETIALNVGTQVVDGERVSPTVVDDIAPASPPASGARPTVTADASRPPIHEGL